MSSLEQFEILRKFKFSESPETDFLAYCAEVLGSVERYHTDFKEKRDRRTFALEDADKKNLAKAVSGFANSGGGVLIWGIEDKSLKPKPISDIQTFISALLSMAPQVTDPVVEGIDGEWFPSADDSNKGYALIHIPESVLPPHRVVLNNKDIRNHYYIRSGDSFIIAPHTQLEDMFGRRPKPRLNFFYRIKVVGGSLTEKDVLIFIGIENIGRGSAKSPFLAVHVHQPYDIYEYGIDGNRRFGMQEMISGIGSNWRKYGGSTEVVIHPSVIHEVTAIKIKVNVAQSPSYTENLCVDYQIAAEGVRLIEDQILISNTTIWDELKKY